MDIKKMITFENFIFLKGNVTFYRPVELFPSFFKLEREKVHLLQ